MKKPTRKKRGKLRKTSKRRKAKPEGSQESLARSCPGFDFGILPRVATVFNPEFIELWQEAGCIAMAYTSIPQIGLHQNVPFVGIFFKNYEVGSKLFRLIGKWMDPPGNQSAVDMSFIEDKKRNIYIFHMSVNTQQLLLRTFGVKSERDFQQLSFTGGVGKEFQISKLFQDFKKHAIGKNIFICPMKVNFDYRSYNFSSIKYEMKPEEMDYKFGFWKNDIQFLDKERLDANSIEYHFCQVVAGENVEKKKSPHAPTSSPLEVEKRRIKQLTRFFPVVLARLPHNRSFLEAKAALQERYLEWQINQAACNLMAKENWPEDGCGGGANMFSIYNNLRQSTQDATEERALNFKFSPAKLEVQIRMDVELRFTPFLEPLVKMEFVSYND